MVVELRPHQLQALRDISPGKIVNGGVGSGKTITSLAYFYTKICNGIPQSNLGEYKPMETPTDLYVITTARKRNDKDWEREAARFPLGWATDPNGVQMHVDSWNNISNYEHVTDAFFIFDEQRLVGSGAWVKSFLKIAKHNRWIILSATPGDTWVEYLPVFIANGFYKNRTEFAQRHIVWSRFAKYPKIERYLEEPWLESLRSRVLVEMEYASHATRHLRFIPVEHDTALAKVVVEKRWNPFKEEPLKNAAEMFMTLRRVLNSDPSRIGEAMRLIEKHPRLIIFYNFKYELAALRILMRTLNYPYAEWNGENHQDIPEGEKWVYLVQYAANEGWNCITTDSMLLYSLNHSYKVFEQVQGRIDRMNTPFKDLNYYILRSDHKLDHSIWRAIVSKKDFNAKAFTKALWPEERQVKVYQ